MTLLSRYWIRHFTKSLWWALLPLISVCLLYPNAIAQRHPVQPCLMHCQDGASLIPAQPDQPSAYLETKSAHPLDRTSGKDGPLLSLNASSYGFSLALLQCAAFIPLPDLLPGFPKSGGCFPWPRAAFRLHLSIALRIQRFSRCAHRADEAVRYPYHMRTRAAFPALKLKRDGYMDHSTESQTDRKELKKP